MQTSFAMYLIDTGKADACAIGWLYNWISNSEYDDILAVQTDVCVKVTVPEYMYDKTHVNQIMSMLAWIYPNEWRAWCAMVRMLS